MDFELKVGQEVYIYNENKRIYLDDNGNKTRNTNFKLHYEKYFLYKEGHKYLTFSRQYSEPWKGEKLPASRLLKLEKKLLERDDRARLLCLNWEEVLQYSWVNDNAYKISEKVILSGYNKLKQIADLIGYQ